MRKFIWQHVSRVYVTGKVESDYLIAEEHDSEPLLENLSADEVKNLRDVCDHVLRFNEVFENGKRKRQN